MAILTQTRGPSCGSGADWNNWEDALEEDLITSRPTPYASIEDPEDVPTLILACFGFTIPLTATVISVSISKFLVVGGTVTQVWEIAQTRDASTPLAPSTTKTITAGAAYQDIAPFDMPDGLPTPAQANNSGFGVIITTTKPAMGQTGAGLDYMQITITYDDNEVEAVVLSGEAGDTTASLSWTEADGADEYRLERATAEGGPYVSVYEGTDLSFDDSSLTNGVTYWYRCYAVRGVTDSDASNLVSLTPEAPASAPTMETWVQAGNVRELHPKPSYMTGSWTEVEDAVEYELVYSYDQVTWTQGYLGELLESDVRINSLVEEGIDDFGPIYAKARAKVGDVWTDYSTPLSGWLKYLWNGDANRHIRLVRSLRTNE